MFTKNFCVLPANVESQSSIFISRTSAKDKSGQPKCMSDELPDTQCPLIRSGHMNLFHRA